MRIASAVLLLPACASALRLSVRAPAPRMASPTSAQDAASAVEADATPRASTLPGFAADALSTLQLSDPTTLPDAEREELAGAAAAGAALLFVSPLFDGNFLADLAISSVVGGAALGYCALRQDEVGTYARKAGSLPVVAASKAREIDAQLGLSAAVAEKMPGGGASLSMDDIKKYGVAGTVAYILTELAFWIVAFPVAAFALYNSAGHWPDLADGSDRAALFGFVFAGANLARLAVPLRFGAAFALAPWVDENIVTPVQAKFGKDD